MLSEHRDSALQVAEGKQPPTPAFIARYGLIRILTTWNRRQLVDGSPYTLFPDALRMHVKSVSVGANCRVVAKRGVVVAAGAWSGHVLEAATGDATWGTAFRARRGHLLQLCLPADMAPLAHGLMEADYSKARPLHPCLHGTAPSHRRSLIPHLAEMNTAKYVCSTIVVHTALLKWELNVPFACPHLADRPLGCRLILNWNRESWD